MDRKDLFTNALEELATLSAKSQSQITEYELLRISSLLRLLLIAREPLFEQINREYRLKIRFRSAYPASMSVQDLPEPPFPGGPPIGGGTKTLPKQDFLQRYAGFIAPHSYTVREIILYGANVAGGVHAGEPKSEEHTSIKNSEGFIQVFDKEPALLELLGIGRVVVRGLDPLYRSVRSGTS